jgi:hypothetical protein
MPYKDKKDRRKYYQKNKEEINRKRREYNSSIERKQITKEQFKVWRSNNLERAKQITGEAKKKYEKRCKDLVFEYYGKICSCCGESNSKFLTIDHVNGGGRKHRSEIKSKIQIWLVKNNFPDGFETLCYNCNCGKNINHGICPHKDIK